MHAYGVIPMPPSSLHSLLRTPTEAVDEIVTVQDRGLFHAILNMEEFPGCHVQCREHARRLLDSMVGRSRLTHQSLSLTWGDAAPQIKDAIFSAECAPLFRRPETAELTESDADFTALQYAANALLDGFGLHCAAQAHMGRTHIAAALHRCSMKIGSRHGSRSAFRANATSIAITLPRVTSSEFSFDRALLAISLAIPLADMCLGLFSKEFMPELLGFNFCRSLFGPPAPVDLLSPYVASHHGIASYLDESSAHRSEQLSIVDNILIAIRELIGQEGSSVSKRADLFQQRVWLGFELHRFLVECWNGVVVDSLNHRQHNAEQEMLELIRRKAPYAAGYHRDIRLGGRSIDKLLLDDPQQLLKEMAASPYICSGQSDKSKFLTQSIAFGGPMFRVFNEAEVKIIERWIKSLPPSANSNGISPQAQHNEIDCSFDVSPLLSDALRGYKASHVGSGRDGPLSLRELYHRLINIEDNYEILPRCYDFILDWLRATTASSRPYDDLINHYGREELRTWIQARLERQRHEYRPLRVPPAESKEALISDCLQMSPMIFVDGAWLQNWGRPQLADSPIGSLLFKIYSDEIGNGEVEMNHSNIFRSLLESMKTNLPDEKSWEFAHLHTLDDDSFRVPAFWMSLSHFPNRFLPETLGLNLAMELSGVGGSYRTARELLVYYGFSPLFVDLHNTIDNADTGHAAMALKAIEHYMEDAAALGTPEISQICWQRIRAGFSALKPPSSVHWKLQSISRTLMRASSPLRTLFLSRNR